MIVRRKYEGYVKSMSVKVVLARKKMNIRIETCDLLLNDIFYEYDCWSLFSITKSIGVVLIMATYTRYKKKNWIVLALFV